MMKEFSEDINEYLKCDEVIDFDNTDVSKLADQLYSESESETEFVKMAWTNRNINYRDMKIYLIHYY